MLKVDLSYISQTLFTYSQLFLFFSSQTFSPMMNSLINFIISLVYTYMVYRLIVKLKQHPIPDHVSSDTQVGLNSELYTHT